MVVRLTHAQWFAVRARISPHLIQILTEHRKPIGKSHDYLLPAIGWRRVLDQLTAVAYGPMGGKVAGGQTLYRAIQKIADAVGKIESHPALTVGRAVAGFSSDLIPAWCHIIERSPYPVPAWHFTILQPEHLVRGNRMLTVWVPGSPDPHQVLHDPAFHLFVGSEPELGLAGVPELH